MINFPIAMNLTDVVTFSWRSYFHGHSESPLSQRSQKNRSWCGILAARFASCPCFNLFYLVRVSHPRCGFPQPFPWEPRPTGREASSLRCSAAILNLQKNRFKAVLAAFFPLLQRKSCAGVASADCSNTEVFPLNFPGTPPLGNSQLVPLATATMGTGCPRVF